MAVNDKKPDSSSFDNRSISPTFGAAKEQSVSNDKPSFFQGLGSMFGSVLDQSVMDKQLRETFTRINDLFTKTKISSNIELFAVMVDNENNPKLTYSSIVVAVRDKQSPDLTPYFTLIFESSGILEPRTESINGKPVEIIMTPGDAFNIEMIRVIEDRLSKQITNTRFICCDAMVVPKNFNPEDEQALNKLANSATLACGTELKMIQKDFKDVQLTEMLSTLKDSNLRINLSFNRDEVYLDEVGNPVRSDILIQMTASPNHNTPNQSYVNNGDKVTKICEVTAYIDLVYAPATPQTGFNGFNPMYQQQQQTNQLFVPRLVITNIKSFFSYTPASIVLAMYAAFSLEEKMSWVHTFVSSRMTKTGELDIRDIGFLNLECMIGNKDPQATVGIPFDTRTSTWNTQQLAQFLTLACRPNLIISVDVPVCGSQSWYTGFLSSAAKGVPSAVKAFENAANNLTNGNFERFMGTMPNSNTKDTDYFTDHENKVLMGYYTARGEAGVRDIRDIDRLAIVNFYATQPSEFKEWDAALNRKDTPLAVRLQYIRSRINHVTGDKAVITGYADRITLKNSTARALAQGAMAVGMSVTINTPSSGADFSTQRTSATFVNDAVLGNGNLFQHQQQGVFGNKGTMTQNSMRWTI